MYYPMTDDSCDDFRCFRYLILLYYFNTMYFIKTSYLGDEAQRSSFFFFWRFEPENVLKMFLNFGFVARFSSSSQLVVQQMCCVRVLANQPISALHFFNPQQMFLLRVKLITQGEKRETSIKTCNETMLRYKLRVFVSRFSPP